MQVGFWEQHAHSYTFSCLLRHANCAVCAYDAVMTHGDMGHHRTIKKDAYAPAKKDSYGHKPPTAQKCGVECERVFQHD